MRELKSFLDLCRISNLPTVWTNVLTAALLAAGKLPGALPLLILAGSCCYMGGMSLNDYCDAEYDRLHKATRPIPSGRISRNTALTVSLVLFASGLLLLTFAPHAAGIPGGLLLILTITAYDFRHKNNPLSVLLMAACRLLLFLVTALALTGTVTPLVLLAAGLQFAYVLLLSVVARQEARLAPAVPFPLIPAMIAGISLLDGSVLALSLGPYWFTVGIAGSVMTWLGQRYVRGD